MLISYVVSTGSSSQLVFIINLIGVWMTLSTTDDVWMTSSAIDDVVRKECHGKQNSLFDFINDDHDNAVCTCIIWERETEIGPTSLKSE